MVKYATLHEELALFMPVNSPSDYFPREIALYILTSCDTFQPIKLHYPHPKNNKDLYSLSVRECLVNIVHVT